MYNIETFKIAQHLNNIGYVVFFEDLTDKHLFKLKGACEIKKIQELEDDRPRNQKGVVYYYITIDLDLSEELDASKLTPSLNDEKQPEYAELNDITTVRGGK